MELLLLCIWAEKGEKDSNSLEYRKNSSQLMEKWVPGSLDSLSQKLLVSLRNTQSLHKWGIVNKREGSMSCSRKSGQG